MDMEPYPMPMYIELIVETGDNLLSPRPESASCAPNAATLIQYGKTCSRDLNLTPFMSHQFLLDARSMWFMATRTVQDLSLFIEGGNYGGPE